MNRKLEIGDVVCLKSGGPTMTITVDYEDGTFQCQRFLNDKLEVGMFPGEALELVDKSAS